MIATSPPVPPTKETLHKRRVWLPSPRERAMYRAVAVEGRTQHDVGAEFGRSQSAVSRLVQRFERWRGGAKGEECGELDPQRQAHLDRWLERERAEEVYQRSMRLALKMEQAPATTRREGDRGVKEEGKKWFEETKRDQLAAAGQMLKTALRANESLGKLADKEPLPPLPGADSPIDYEELLGVLTRLRKEAEETGRVPKSDRAKSMADIWLRALVGERQEWYLAHHASDCPALVEMIESVLKSRIGLKEAVGGLESAAGNQEPGEESVLGTEYSVPSTDDAEAPSPSSIIPNPPSPDHSPLTDSPLTPPPPQTHQRIDDIDQYYAPIPNPPKDTTRSRGNPYDPLSGLMRVVMIDPATGKKFGATDDEYADDPLGRTYQRAKERHERERRGW